MKRAIFMSLLLLSACAPQTVPPHIQQKVDAIPAEQLPRYFMIERHKCRSGTKEENVVCKEKVRREYLANQMAREERSSQ